MNILEATLLKESLKPTSGIIDALIGTKIEKLKKWSKNREIESQIKDEKFKALLTEHIKRTIKKTSQLSTIVFPQQKLNINDVYIPLKVRESTSFHSYSKVTTRTKIDPSVESKSYLIIDSAGMGKSTYSKAFCLSIIRDTEKTPLFFEVIDFNNKHSLIENIAKTLDDFGKDFDRELFKKLLIEGHFFIIIDGFDEATSSDKDILRPQIKELSEKKGKASLMLTSRPEERLPSLMDSTSYSIGTLNNRQVNLLLRKYDLISNSDIGDRLKKEIDKVPDRFLQTPLLVGLLYRTYGFNLSIAEKISVFYSEVYEALYKGHDLTKNGYVREKISKLDIDNFRKLLRSFAYQYIVRKDNKEHTYESLIKLIKNANEICLYPNLIERNFLDDLTLAVPLITKEGTNLKFIHRSIAEYFAAEFITSINDRKILLSKILDSEMRPLFKETIEYIREIEPNLYQELITSPLAESFISHCNATDPNTSKTYKTTTFIANFFISYWDIETIQKKGKSGELRLNIPKPPTAKQDSESYLYGNYNNKRYVAVIAFYRKRPHIPAGAFFDISEKTDISRLVVESNEDITEINNTLKLGEWYKHDDVEILKNTHLQSFCHLMARNISLH